MSTPINLGYEISQDRSKLHILASPQEQEALQELIAEEGTGDEAFAEALDHLLSNSELQSINPADAGDLTDAPMLGICGPETRERKGPQGAILVGGDSQGNIYSPILERWAYLNYATQSPLKELAETGKITLHNAN